VDTFSFEAALGKLDQARADLGLGRGGDRR
jgi:hypothetical protein